MRKKIITVVLLMSFSQLFAQSGTGKISGTVSDATNKPLQSISVSLLKAADSSVVKMVVSGKDGKYEFANINDGDYIISASAVGHEKNFSRVSVSAANNTVSVPAMQLTEVSKGLTAVTVTSKKPFIETRIDKTIVNVDASPTSAGATALEILEKSPGVTVDNDGNISLKGKQGVIVLMDGKPTYLSPTDLANLLKNTPASALDQIEIMTNPSAKYDATGNSGVLNIKTKKGKNAGFNGSIMVGATTSIYKPRNAVYLIPKSQNSVNFNYRKGKINFFGNYNPNFFRGQNTMNFTNKFFDDNKNIIGYNETETRFKFGNNNHTLKLGLDIYADKKNTWGVVLQGFAFSGHPTPTTVAELQDEHHNIQNRLNSSTDNRIKFKNFSANLNWKHVFDSTGKELTADFDYVVYGNVSDMLLETDYYNSLLQLTGTSYLRGHLPANIDIYTFKSDYLHPFKGGRFEAGVKFSFVKNDNLVNYEKLINDNWEVDKIRSNHFIYDENINAAYVSYSKELKKWSFQAGLRIENTNATGDQVVSNISFKRNNTSLFPTAFVRRNINEKNSLTLSYGRRIQRPNYQDLNPFVYFLDTLSYRQGNIYLRPQYTHNIEVTHAFRDKFITTINYNFTDDVISQIIKQEPNSKIRFSTVDNVAQFRNMGISITAPVSFTKWWNANFFTNVYNNRYKGTYDTIAIDMAFTSFLVNITNNFTLGKGFTAELTGFYRHKAINNLSRMEPIYQVGFGLQKQIMKGKGTVRLNVRDPFAWQKFEGLNQYGLIEGKFLSRPDVRQVTATFTWRFGKSTQQNQPRRRAGSSQDEQNRVGQGGQ
ncbi:MAG: TonB-dependent receptor [Chitinophagaceae bacterium]|nr:TonB-dependent receptor [Chitinophagaceae bacterium]